MNTLMFVHCHVVTLIVCFKWIPIASMCVHPSFALAVPIFISTLPTNCFWKSVILVLPLYFKNHFPVYYLFAALYIYAFTLQMP